MSTEPHVVAEPSASAERHESLSKTVLSVLSGQSVHEIEAARTAIFQNRLSALGASHEAERARAASRMRSLRDEIDRLHDVAAGIPDDRKACAEAEGHVHRLTGEVRALDAEIRGKRYEAERARLQEQLDRVDAQERAAKSVLSAERRAEYEQELVFWQETEQERSRRVGYLEKEKQRVDADTERAANKLEQLADPHITRTLSGFLLWVGYGAAAATGTVTAVLLDDDKSPSAPLADALNGLRAFLLSINPKPSGAWTLLTVAVMLLLAMAAVGGVVYLTDLVISRFDRKWRGGGRDPKGAASLRPPDINRSSYVQLLATFPYVFTLGLVAAVFATGNAGEGQSFLAGLFPSLVNTFIGTVIALIAAAMFVMYAVKAIEARPMREDGKPRSAWEFLFLPLVLVTALVTSTLSSQPDRYVWGTWAAFMLLSALTLAYGVIYHGLFKDLDKLRWIGRRLEDEIRSLTAPPLIAAPGRQELHQAKEIARRFGREKERLRQLDQQFSIKRILTADDNDDLLLFDGWLRSYSSFSQWRRPAARSDIPRTYDAYRVLDAQAAPGEVARREAARAEAAQHQALADDLREVIARKQAQTAAERIDGLERELATAQADFDASVFEERQAIARLESERIEDLQRMRGAIAVGLVNKPGFDAARTHSQPPTPTPPAPPPVIPIHERRHDQ